VAGVVGIDSDGLGPWIGDVFRDPAPAYAGLGAALLQLVLAAAADSGTAEVGLAVSDANPAGRIYERLGFVTAKSLASLVLPPASS
jgi:GNAT superfamily N-acetyltransferase